MNAITKEKVSKLENLVEELRLKIKELNSGICIEVGDKYVSGNGTIYIAIMCEYGCTFLSISSANPFKVRFYTDFASAGSIDGRFALQKYQQKDT